MARIASTTSSGMPVGNTDMTLDALMARQKLLAAQAGRIAEPRQMISPWQGAAMLGETLANKLQQGRTDRQLTAGRDALAQIRAGIDLEAGPTPDQISQASMYDPAYADQLTQLAAQAVQARRARELTLADRAEGRTYEATQEQRINDRELQEDLAKESRTKIQYGQPITGDAAKALGLDPTKTYQQNMQTNQYDPVGGGSGVTINTGDTSSALRKKYDETEGTNWAGYIEAGNKAAGLSAYMSVLDELGKVAPQGPVPGTLQKMFPAMNSAGAAYQSVIKRLAPQMRVEGSGATSDIEYQGMLDSLPSLLNYPEANLLISGVLKAKAQIDMQRADIVTAWRNGEIEDAAARTQLATLNRQSIMTPELRLMIDNAGPAAAGPAGGADLSGMTDEELDAEIARQKALGGP